MLNWLAVYGNALLFVCLWERLTVCLSVGMPNFLSMATLNWLAVSGNERLTLCLSGEYQIFCLWKHMTVRLWERRTVCLWECITDGLSTGMLYSLSLCIWENLTVLWERLIVCPWERITVCLYECISIYLSICGKRLTDWLSAGTLSYLPSCLSMNAFDYLSVGTVNCMSLSVGTPNWLFQKTLDCLSVGKLTVSPLRHRLYVCWNA